MAFESRAEAVPSFLVCVYYRVAASDHRRAVGQVRDFQRTLREHRPGLVAEVLIRSDSSSSANPTTFDSGSEPSPPVADPTLMETYRLTFLVPSDADGAAAFLADLETAARPLAPFLRGTRHVEVFSPCAS